MYAVLCVVLEYLCATYSDVCRNCTGQILKVQSLFKDAGHFESLATSVGKTLMMVKVMVMVTNQHPR